MARRKNSDANQVGYIYSKEQEEEGSSDTFNYSRWCNVDVSNVEQELINLREVSQKAIVKSWKEVETLTEKCSKDQENISKLEQELKESRKSTTQSKARITKLEEELYFYRSAEGKFAKKMEEQRKRLTEDHRRALTAANIDDDRNMMSRFSSSPSLLGHLLPTKKDVQKRSVSDSPLMRRDTISTATSTTTTNTATNTNNTNTTLHSCPPILQTHCEDSKHDDHELKLKISSRDAAIESLEWQLQDNINRMSLMSEEMKRLKDLLDTNGISYEGNKL